MSAPNLSSLSGDACALLSTLAVGETWTQRDLALAALGLAPQALRRVQAAIQEARLAGWPIVSDGEGIRLSSDPGEVAACAVALRRRAGTAIRTLVIDEPDGLDAEARRAFGAALRVLAHHGELEQVVVVSHHEDLAEAGDAVYRVSKGPGGSVVEQIQ